MKKIILIALLIIVIIIISAVVYVRYTRRLAITKEYIEQRFSQLRQAYQDKLEKGYDLTEVLNYGKQAREAYNTGDFKLANQLLDQAFRTLEWAKIPPEPIEQCPICPDPSSWGSCTNNQQTRTNYKCNASTNYECQAYIETRSCISSTCSDGTLYGQCSSGKPKYCDNGNLINRCSVCNCPANQLCNTTSEACYTSTTCSGSVSLNLTPSTVEPSSSVILSASGLAGCDNKIVYFKKDGCTGTQVSSCSITNGGCSGSAFTAPSSEGLYTYYACIDKNSDGDFGDSGEYYSKTLNVSTPKVTDLWLHVDGKYIKNSQGNVVVLHGINYETYAISLRWKYSDHIEEDYKKIADWGFNVVRLGISWQYIEPTEGYYNESYFTELVDRDIEWAKKYGIYVIINFHKWRWSYYFNYSEDASYGYGLPIWLLDGYPNSEDGKLQSMDDFWLGKGPDGTEATPENPSMQDRAIKVWKYIANRYKDEPSILGYDLFNEPPKGTLNIEGASNYLYPFYERLVDEIKAVDNNHVFIYEPIIGRWDYAPRLLNRPNTIFSTHLYPGYYDDTKFGYSGDIKVLENQLLGYFKLPTSNPSRNWNIPILMGEFGESQLPLYSNRFLWVNDMADLYNKYNIHWASWSYCVSNPTATSGCDFSIVNPDRTEVKPKADALDKPYPRISSIPPSTFSFDRNTKHFKTVFDGVGSVETEIYVPSRYYPSFTVNSNSSSWSKNWDETNKLLTVSAALEGPIEITIDPA